MIDLHNAKVLVTGGTGFIGGRLVECLVADFGADVNVLVRDFSKVPRIARYEIRMLSGDVTDPRALEGAMEGCEVVFHCAYGNAGGAAQRKKVTIQGMKNVLRAALQHKVKRVVHVSTISVYGRTDDGDLDESAPRKYSKDAYADSKLEAEILTFRYFEKYGLPVSIIQPTVVYGPYARVWTVDPINRLKTGRVVLVEGGDGLCNAVYVDDVVQAMIQAATRDEAVGEAFLISAEEPVTWREFYGAYERMLGIESTISLTVSEITRAKQRHIREAGIIAQVRTALREHPHLLNAILGLPAVARVHRVANVFLPSALQRRILAALLGKGATESHQAVDLSEKPLLPLTRAQIDFFRARTRVRIDKAKRLLGYEPAFDFERGMRLTEMWGKYSGLV